LAAFFLFIYSIPPRHLEGYPHLQAACHPWFSLEADASRANLISRGQVGSKAEILWRFPKNLNKKNYIRCTLSSQAASH
jgi:hypothetical protein